MFGNSQIYRYQSASDCVKPIVKMIKGLILFLMEAIYQWFSNAFGSPGQSSPPAVSGTKSNSAVAGVIGREGRK